MPGLDRSWRIDGLYQGPQDRDYRRVQNSRQRYRIAGSTSRAPQRAHQLPHGTFQSSREGSSFTSRPAEAGWPAPAAARLSQEQGYGSVRGADSTPRHPQVAAPFAMHNVNLQKREI